MLNEFQNDIQCIYSDFNASNLVFRIRIVESLFKSKKTSLDQSDEIYMLKNIQENILNNIILKGIKNIKKINARTIKNSMKKSNGNWIPKDIWVLDTVGSNLKDILTLDNIDIHKTFSNDIQEVYKVLGIEAARLCIHNELIECYEQAGKINYHHTSMLCDRICATQKMVSIFRHGINNDDIGPLAKASFEETSEMFLKAARHGELDELRGISANVMCGQEGYFGTSAFQVYLNIPKMQKFEEISLEENSEEVDMMEELGECSISTIKLRNNTSIRTKIDLGGDDDYELDI